MTEDLKTRGRPFHADFPYKTWRAFFYLYIFNNFIYLLFCDETDQGKGGLDKGMRERTKCKILLGSLLQNGRLADKRLETLALEDVEPSDSANTMILLMVTKTETCM